MQITEAFKGKTLVITGGTGSFGSTVLKHFLTTDIGEIRIISRDEKKQDWMRHTLQALYPDYCSKVQFYIGDVRNLDSVRDVMYGADYVFHAAALKEVPSCEFFPMEAVRTNIIGTDNVITAAVEAGVQRVVFLSTDKAAYPINTMGMTKAVGEKVVQARAQKAFERGGTVLACTRYGNVMCSRGSVIPLFIDQIKRKAPITITDPNMTRFLMNLDEAVDLVAFAFEHAEPGDLFVQKADASTIGDLADGVMKVFGETEKKIIGSRHGEKLELPEFINESLDLIAFVHCLSSSPELAAKRLLLDRRLSMSPAWESITKAPLLRSSFNCVLKPAEPMSSATDPIEFLMNV